MAYVVVKHYKTRIQENVLNYASGKIKLTLPADSCATILLV